MTELGMEENSSLHRGAVDRLRSWGLISLPVLRGLLDRILRRRCWRGVRAFVGSITWLLGSWQMFLLALILCRETWLMRRLWRRFAWG